MLNILIADDHPLIRKGLREVISAVEGMEVTEEASNSREVLKKVNQNKFDVILLDITMPGRSGLEILKEIKEEAPKLPVLVLSAHPEEKYAIRALKAGASGYLTKESATKELISAVRKVSTGGKYVSSSLAEKLAFAFDDGSEKDLHEKLSDRELEVMCMIASGKSTRDIAEELCLSEKTVSTYRMRIQEKMDVKNPAEMTYYAVKHGLIE